MPEQKNTWEIEQLKKQTDRVEAEVINLKKDVDDLQSFRDTSVQKFITIFNRLKEMQEGDQWVKRIFIGALVTGAIGSIFSFIVWAVQN